MIKYTYNFLKDFIEDIPGYKFLSTKYINAHQRLIIQCPKNHIFTMRPYNFINGKRCTVCSHGLRTQYIKVKEYIEGIQGYLLLSSEYSNNKGKLRIQCPKGHLFEMSLSKFKSGQRCRKCSSTYSFEYIKKDIENRGFTLISDRYDNCKDKLQIKCPNGHLFLQNYNSIQSGHGCKICYKEKVTPTIEHIKKYASDVGYTIISSEYINAKSNLEIKCNNKHIFLMTWNNFKSGQRCPHCSMKGTSKPEREVQEYVRMIYTDTIICNDRNVIKPLELDIYLPEINKAVEIGSIYYHSKDDRIQSDNLKIEKCKQNNINLLQIVYVGKWKTKKEGIINQVKRFIND